MDSLKAYWVGDDEGGVIVFASTRGKARQIGANELTWDFIDTPTARLPELDVCATSRAVTCADLERANFAPDHRDADGHLIVFEGDGYGTCVRCPWLDDDVQMEEPPA